MKKSVMIDNFPTSLTWVLKHEGGFSNHPLDPGGMTNLGVTARTYAEFLGRRLSTITEKEIRSLTVEKVKPIYKRLYWDACKCDKLPSGIDYALFDYAVNSGPARAIKILQRCLAVADDGILGPDTLKHILAANQTELIKEYLRRRLDFLRDLSTFKTFGRGWTARVVLVEKQALSLVEDFVEPIRASTIDDDTRARALEYVRHLNK